MDRLTMDTDLQTSASLVQPTAVLPAALAQYVPPPQPAYHPAGNPQMPGVVVMPNGDSYYGFAPATYAQQPADPKVIEQVALMNAKARLLGGSGVCAAGFGYGINEAVGAVAGASAGTLLMAAALVLAARAKAPRQIINHITEEHRYDQSITNIARGWFSRANGTLGNNNSKTFTNNT